MKDHRNITVKSNLTVDQYFDLVADAKAAGNSISSVLRDSWLKHRNVKPDRPPVARPTLGRFQAKFAPGRVARPELRLRH